MGDEIIRQRNLHPIRQEDDPGVSRLQGRRYVSAKLPLQERGGTGKAERQPVFLTETEGIDKEKPAVDAV